MQYFIYGILWYGILRFAVKCTVPMRSKRQAATLNWYDFLSYCPMATRGQYCKNVDQGFEWLFQYFHTFSLYWACLVYWSILHILICKPHLLVLLVGSIEPGKINWTQKTIWIQNNCVGLVGLTESCCKVVRIISPNTRSTQRIIVTWFCHYSQALQKWCDVLPRPEDLGKWMLDELGPGLPIGNFTPRSCWCKFHIK